VYYYPFILARWIFTVLVLAVLRDFYALQLLLLYVLSLISQYLLVHLKPMRDMSENYLGVFNEFTVQIYIYLMIALSEYNGANPFREELGFGLVAIILVSLAISVLKFLTQLVIALVKICLVLYEKRKAKKYQEIPGSIGHAGNAGKTQQLEKA
jgi:hypothetical protein